MIVATEGGELAEVAGDYLWQHEFGEVATEFEHDFPGQYAGARRLEEHGGPYIAFKGAMPDGASVTLAQLSRPIRIIEDRGYSLAELIETQIAAVKTLRIEPVRNGLDPRLVKRSLW